MRTSRTAHKTSQSQVRNYADRLNYDDMVSTMIWFVSIRHYSFASVFRSFGDMELFLEDPGPLVLCEEQRESMVCRVCLPESGGYSGTLLFAFKKMLAFQTSVAPWICNRRRSPSKVYVPWWTPHVECGRWKCAEPTPEDTYHFGSRTSHFVKNSQSIQTKSFAHAANPTPLGSL